MMMTQEEVKDLLTSLTNEISRAMESELGYYLNMNSMQLSSYFRAVAAAWSREERCHIEGWDGTNTVDEEYQHDERVH